MILFYAVDTCTLGIQALVKRSGSLAVMNSIIGPLLVSKFTYYDSVKKKEAAKQANDRKVKRLVDEICPKWYISLILWIK